MRVLGCGSEGDFMWWMLMEGMEREEKEICLAFNGAKGCHGTSTSHGTRVLALVEFR